MYAQVTGTTVNTFPYSIGQLKRDNPNVSFSSAMTLDDVAAYGVVLVTQQADPAFDDTTEYLVQGVPVFNDPNWEVTRVVTAMTQAEIDAAATSTARAEDIATLKADAQVLALLKARPSAINNYIDTNVTDMASAREVLKILARASAVLAHTVVN
jgi:hypothetical protein